MIVSTSGTLTKHKDMETMEGRDLYHIIEYERSTLLLVFIAEEI